MSEDYGSEILVEVRRDGKPIRFGVRANEGRFGATLSLEQVEAALSDYEGRLTAWHKENH